LLLQRLINYKKYLEADW